MQQDDSPNPNVVPSPFPSCCRQCAKRPWLSTTEKAQIRQKAPKKDEASSLKLAGPQNRAPRNRPQRTHRRPGWPHDQLLVSAGW